MAQWPSPTCRLVSAPTTRLPWCSSSTECTASRTRPFCCRCWRSAFCQTSELQLLWTLWVSMEWHCFFFPSPEAVTTTSSNLFTMSRVSCTSLQIRTGPCPTGGVKHHRDSAGHEPLHWLCSAASADPLRCSLRQHRAPRSTGRLHAADHLQVVQRPLTHQSPKGCHWRVSAGYLQVSPAKLVSDLNNK